MSTQHFNISEKILTTYKKEVERNYKPLTKEQECELAKRIKKGDKKAVKDLVMANLFFVINIAREYSNYRVPQLDLINIGNLGLIDAAKKFDGSKNFKFMTYAVWFIRRDINRALLEQFNIVRIPDNKMKKFMELEKAKDRLAKKKNRKITHTDICTELGIKNHRKLQEIETAGNSYVSLDSLNSSGYPLINDIRDEGSLPDEGAILESERADLEMYLTVLNPMQKKVIREFYGLDGKYGRNLNEIGIRHRLSRERIRQIHDQALMILRHKYTT